MSFIRIKKVKNWTNKYLVENKYNKKTKKVQQKTIQYLGRTIVDNKMDKIELDYCKKCGSKTNLTILFMFTIALIQFKKGFLVSKT